jgi:hypothetical protein
MQKTNSEILNHFYSLLIELNFYRDEDDVFVESKYQDDPFIMKHLKLIRLKTTKYRVILNKHNYSNILIEFKRLSDIGFDEIKKFLNPQEQMRIQPLFRKFEELTEKDKSSIEEDQELLQLIAALKDKLDNPEDE